jgi:type I restriction enzyme S subunit
MRIIQNDLDSLTKKSEGTAQKNLLLRDIRTHPISFPKSRITQRDLLEQLFSFENQITNLLNNYQKKLEKLQELKQSILHKAFNGEL